MALLKKYDLAMVVLTEELVTALFFVKVVLEKVKLDEGVSVNPSKCKLSPAVMKNCSELLRWNCDLAFVNARLKKSNMITGRFMGSWIIRYTCLKRRSRMEIITTV